MFYIYTHIHIYACVGVYTLCNVCTLYRVGELLVDFQDVAFLPLQAIFPITFLKVVVVVKASGPPRVLEL